MKALVLLLPALVLADVGFKQGTANIGPVRDLSCVNDGGIYCSRDAGSAIGGLRCITASATETGCVTPASQTFAGTKTLSGDLRLIGHVHASLTACSSGLKGTWQTCTTHNAPVFCNGTSNIEMLGGSSSEVVLFSESVNGTPAPVWGKVTLPSANGWTLNAVTGGWGAGGGTGASMRLTFTGAAGACNCDVDCDVPLFRTSCSGTCTWTAGDTIVFSRPANGSGSFCSLDPVVGSIALMGVVN